MRFSLDTNAVIALMGGVPDITAQIKRHRPADFALSAVVLHELLYGAYKSQRQQENVARVQALRFAVLPLDADDAQVAGQIRAALAAAGTPIGPHDVLIAGQAVARDLILVSRNVGELSRISGLRLENWQD